jgi:hypothetical protein
LPDFSNEEIWTLPKKFVKTATRNSKKLKTTSGRALHIGVSTVAICGGAVEKQTAKPRAVNCKSIWFIKKI